MEGEEGAGVVQEGLEPQIPGILTPALSPVRTTMPGASKIIDVPCPILTKDVSFEWWRREVKMWDSFTEMPKVKRGPYLLLNIPAGVHSELKKKVYLHQEYNEQELKGENGVTHLLKIMELVEDRDPLVNRFETFQKLCTFKRDKNQDIEDYIMDYCELFKKGEEKAKLPLRDYIKAMMILLGSNLTGPQKQLVANKCDFGKISDNETDDNMAARLLKEVIARLKTNAGQQKTLLSGTSEALVVEEDVEVFLASEKGRKLLKKRGFEKKIERRRSNSDPGGSPRVFKCWHCDKEGHRRD